MLALHARIFATSSVRRLVAAAGLSLALLTPLHAQDPHAYEPSLILKLPPYCKHTMFFADRVPGGNNPDEIQRWKALIGPTFIHMHHYCYGLMATNRAIYSSPTRADRMHNLGVSIVEFDYVIQRAPPEFGLLPEILANKGENLILLERGPEGVGVLQNAIDIKPDYWRPYAIISDYYKDIGAPAKAREWLEKGLSAAPGTHALTRRLAQLDGEQGKSNRKKSVQAPVER